MEVHLCATAKIEYAHKYVKLIYCIVRTKYDSGLGAPLAPSATYSIFHCARASMMMTAPAITTSPQHHATPNLPVQIRWDRVPQACDAIERQQLFTN